MSWTRLRLDVDRFDAASAAAALDRCRADGLRMVSYAVLGDTPEHRRALYELNRECSADIPDRGPFYTYQQYVAERIEVASFDADGVIIAVDGERWVGMTALSDRGDHAFVEMTGVVRDHRGKGLSLALKAHAIEHARARGVRWIRTLHHPANAAAIGANRRLGFVDDVRQQ